MHASSNRSPNALSASRPTLRALSRPAVGTALLILAGLSFMLVCMTLPLVGPAGSAAPWARANFLSFLGLLLATLALSGLAFASKLIWRRQDGGPFPFVSSAIFAICTFLLIALLSGFLRI